MEYKKGKLHQSFNRDNYWIRVLLKSSDKDKQTSVFLCVSYEYLEDALETNNLSDTMVNTWVDTVVKEWKSKGDGIFRKPFHLEVRAITGEGYKNGIDFLQKEVVPVT